MNSKLYIVDDYEYYIIYDIGKRTNHGDIRARVLFAGVSVNLISETSRLG